MACASLALNRQPRGVSLDMRDLHDGIGGSARERILCLGDHFADDFSRGRDRCDAARNLSGGKVGYIRTPRLFCRRNQRRHP